MKERGMIFNSEMVRAILDGRKTQTRRIMKPQPEPCPRGGHWWPSNVFKTMLHVEEEMQNVKGGWGGLVGDACPFGDVGDRIWVRETWGVVSYAFSDDGLMIDWVPDRPATAIHEMPFGNGYYSGCAIYAADGDFTWGDDDGYEDGRSCWKPSIHMPRAASRILLEITDVRVERLNAISEEDAEAEGIDMEALYDSQDCYDCIADHNMTGRPTVTGAFKYLWESIYGEEGWKSNPWVWVIEFKRVED
ncbi:Morphogenetic protein [Klebsiella variicola]|uniref:hypothetical protein n=1 Tax=Klebsiella variicola TaxID=244366 RepID=UPI00109BA4AC|nr:hypothetical protein [Klebsiella variicola]VGP71560.1 hypothetical protein SB5387_01058 [Klebsiella variicola]